MARKFMPNFVKTTIVVMEKPKLYNGRHFRKTNKPKTWSLGGLRLLVIGTSNREKI